MSLSKQLKPDSTSAVAGIASRLGLSSDALRMLGRSLRTAPPEVKVAPKRGRPRLNLTSYNPECECCQRRREAVNEKARNYWVRLKRERPEIYRSIKQRNAELMRRKRTK